MKNIVLIGMPGSGKSTVGVLLAKAIGFGFIDTDLLIQGREGKLLCDIIKEKGAEAFLRIEEEITSGVSAENCVIATGGSVVYGASAMKHFQEIGPIVDLKVSESELEKRLKNLFRRGVVMRKPGETLSDLYSERVPLYERYALVTISCDGQSVEETVRAVAEGVAEVWRS